MSIKPLLDFISQSPEQTLLAGEHLGSVCEGGEVIWLAGALGAGKTVLAQGIALGLGVQGQVTSPTFTLLKEYWGSLKFNHFDFYRLDGQVRDAETEFAEYQQPDAVCVVEWAEHAAAFLPDDYLRITLRYVSPSKRAIQLAAFGHAYENLLRRFQALAFRA
jgi:tRNA threonylcarbamoyladenosine biosynthesis protein TsaE